MSDEELERQFAIETARYEERLRLQVAHATEAGLTYFTALERAVASDCGLSELPQAGQDHSAFAGDGKLAIAAVRTATARWVVAHILKGLSPELRIDVALAISAAAEAGYSLAYHRAEPFLDELAGRTAAATETRRRSDWREAANSAWQERPTLAINAVASRLIAGGIAAESQRRSLIRAIGPLAPSSSTSQGKRRTAT